MCAVTVEPGLAVYGSTKGDQSARQGIPSFPIHRHERGWRVFSKAARRLHSFERPREVRTALRQGVGVESLPIATASPFRRAAAGRNRTRRSSGLELALRVATFGGAEELGLEKLWATNWIDSDCCLSRPKISPKPSAHICHVALPQARPHRRARWPHIAARHRVRGEHCSIAVPARFSSVTDGLAFAALMA